MLLDLSTLHFSSAASRCSYVIVFIVLILSQRRQDHLRHWMGAMSASMVGSFIMMRVAPDTLPAIPVVIVVYSLFAASLVLSWTGFRTFFGKPVNIGLGALLVAVTGFIYPLVIVAGLSERLALAAVFTCCLFLAILTLRESVRGRIGGSRLWSQYFEITAFGLYALVFLLSIGMLIGTDLPIASAESARASMILDQVVGIFVYFGYVAMSAERANRELLLIAETDPLTGLRNRRGLRNVLPAVTSRGRRFPTGILLADIDHFKLINDRYGHEIGDLVLVAFANRLRGDLRASDHVARWGGEEFLAILPGTCMAELAAVAERLRAVVEAQPFSFANGSLVATISIGIATMEPEDDDFEAAARRADAALYEAKGSGRNRVRTARAIAPAPSALAEALVA